MLHWFHRKKKQCVYCGVVLCWVVCVISTFSKTSTSLSGGFLTKLQELVLLMTFLRERQLIVQDCVCFWIFLIFEKLSIC